MLIQTSFLVPIREDREVGNGRRHKRKKWNNLQDTLYRRFGGHYGEPRICYQLGLCKGDYDDEGVRVVDKCRKYTVAIEPERLDEMRRFLKKVADDFKQKCIYFEYEGGHVEYIYGTYCQQ
jgi:hypothetical protein